MGNSTRDVVAKTGDMIEGRYRIIQTLGAGGMGTVFLAEHALIKRRVAIKILHSDLATDANVVERFMNEARAAGTLGHPNIVESTDMGFTKDHVPYIVYEYLEGTLLTDEIYRVGGLPVRRAVRIAEQIASALQAAHDAGIVHRDLKSDNIFLTDKDDALDLVKVLDFGVARFLEADDQQRNMIMGTPEFMSPEQITTPELVDRRADIYALGVILYEMLTARRPFSNEDDPRQLMHRIVTEEPPPLMRPEVPHGLEAIILDRLLAKEPADRFDSMNDVVAALAQFATGGGVAVRRRSAPVAAVAPSRASSDDIRLPQPVPSRDTPWPVDTLDGRASLAAGQVSLPPPPPARRPWALYGVAGLGILLGAGGLMFGLQSNDSKQPAQVAPAAAAVQQLPAPQQAEPAKPEKITVKLDANVPNARVVFRRRVAEAPMSLEINATDVVELVEVSAPGYKTTRYWLTFDRPTTLNAKLVKGTGNLEATEEETLVALGEIAEPTDTPVLAATTPARAPVAVAAAAARPVEKTVEKAAPAAAKPATTTTAMAPRKIGRSAADDTAAASDAAPTETAAAAPAVAMTTTPPAPTTAPAPATTPETAKVVDRAPTAPTPVAAEPAKAEPVATAPVKAEPPKATQEPAKPAELTRPAIDKATVSSVISEHRPEVLKCFAEGKKKNAAMKGTVTLQLQVDPSGKVRAQVQSTLNAPLVAACVVKAASGWKFPSRSGTELAMVTYPFTIN